MQLGIMPLHDEASIERVMNIVSPSEINFVYRDYGYGEIIEEETYDFARCYLDDDDFVVEDMFNEECEIIEVPVEEKKAAHHNGPTDELSIKYSDEDAKSFLRDFDDIERTISGLSSSRIFTDADTDVVSCGGSSCGLTTSSSYTRREIPEQMQRSLRHQLALFLKASESSSTMVGNHSSISKLKIRKRALEKSCHQPSLLHTLPSATVA
mmetsp:Transcript_9923/g.11608  ORF Transcript_9923/g.11608 Transcript_9923/m.11608 type:complete len:210 (+) Transcript_9923:131-760(+)